MRISDWSSDVCSSDLLILWNTGAILLLVGQNATLAALAQDYIRVYMWSIPLFLTTLAFRNFLAALERPMWSLIVGVVGLLGNILFNYAFIFGKLGLPAPGIVWAGVGSRRKHGRAMCRARVWQNVGS